MHCIFCYIRHYVYLCTERKEKIFMTVFKRDVLCVMMSLLTQGSQAEDNAKTWFHDIGLSGFGIVRYQMSAPKGNHRNTFDFRFVRLSLDGRVAKDFYWKTQFQINGNTSTIGSSPRLLDLFAEWQKYPYAKVRVGQFLVPFTFESIYHPMDVKFMGGCEFVDDWTFRSEYVHSTGAGFATVNDGSTTDCSLSKYGNKADGAYACVIAPIKKEKVHVKARWQVYRPAAEWSSAKTQYEFAADYMFNKRLWFTASYVRVNDRQLSDHNYNMVDAQLQFRF